MTARTRRGRPPHDDVLTPAEWRIVHAVQHGMSNREIARRRGISLDAVKFHLDNVRAKLQLGSRQSLRAWFRSPKGSALAQQEIRTMQQKKTMKMQLGPIGQISRSVRNIEAAEAWYREVLGLPHLYTFGKLAFFDCAGTRLFLSENEQSGPESILYLAVADIASVYAELQERGVEFLSPPHMIHKHADGTEEWMAFFKDPEGRPLAIMSRAVNPKASDALNSPSLT
jgi:DNA-binding CsgD family transcriptional regulator/catechol 2,3-dioxygenase-like lactoylglutathione lyase family enzyme